MIQKDARILHHATTPPDPRAAAREPGASPGDWSTAIFAVSPFIATEVFMRFPIRTAVILSLVGATVAGAQAPAAQAGAPASAFPAAGQAAPDFTATATDSTGKTCRCRSSRCAARSSCSRSIPATARTGCTIELTQVPRRVQDAVRRRRRRAADVGRQPRLAHELGEGRALSVRDDRRHEERARDQVRLAGRRRAPTSSAPCS